MTPSQVVTIARHYIFAAVVVLITTNAAFGQPGDKITNYVVAVLTGLGLYSAGSNKSNLGGALSIDGNQAPSLTDYQPLNTRYTDSK